MRRNFCGLELLTKKHKMKTQTEINEIAIEIAVTRGWQERRDAIKKLITDLQEEQAKVSPSNAVLAVTSDSKENKKESEVAVCPNCGIDDWDGMGQYRRCNRCNHRWKEGQTDR